MATTSNIHLKASQKPEYFVKGLSTETAEKANQLLQKNHEEHHIFFNELGSHNHIAHHLLSLTALSATPTQIQSAYNANASYQLPAAPPKLPAIDSGCFETYFGKGKHYHIFLTYLQKEIDAKGVQAVLDEYLFNGTERADDMLVRLYASFLHPIIHLGFGIEFQQPAITTEALAQAAVHDDWMGDFFFGCEKAASSEKGRKEVKTIVQLLEEARASEVLSHAAKYDKDRGGMWESVMERAGSEMIDLAGQYKISEKDDLEEKVAEMINAGW